MRKKIGVVLLIVILLTLPLVPAKNIASNNNQPKKNPIIFDSELQLFYDYDAVRNAIFQPGGPPVFIPIYIQYKVDVPDSLLRPPFFMLKTWFLFDRLIFPQQKITLSCSNIPDWAAVEITPTPLYIQISNDFSSGIAILMIAVHDNAPAEAFTLKIQAEARQLGRIQKNEAGLDIIFAPAWVPLFQVSTSHTYIKTPPNQSTETTINITNLGNAWCLVRADLSENTGWLVILDPTQVSLSIGQTAQMTLLLKPPEGFQGTQAINFTFTPSRFENNGPSLPFTIHAYYP